MPCRVASVSGVCLVCFMRCVAFTVGRDLCFSEKSSTDASKSSAYAAHGTGAKMQDLSALPEATLLCTQASIFSSMVTCVGLCSPGSPCVEHWWKGAATLQMRALCTIGTASKPPASQAFKPAPYCPPVHVLTVCSAPVNRMQSESICGPTISMSIGL